MKKPKCDLKVAVKKREEWKDVIWCYFVGEEVDFTKLSMQSTHTERE
jgi:hypothetical protein